MQTPYRFVTSLLLAAAPGLVQGLGLGELHSSTQVGQAIDAYVDLYASPRERETPFKVTLLHDFMSDPSGITRSTIQAIRLTVEHRAGGYSTIHLQGPVTSSVTPMVVRLRVEHSGRALSRHYTFTARPLSVSGSRGAVRPTTRKLQPQPPINSGKSASDYGPVQSGESLWSIAKRLGNGANTMDLVHAIHRANPHAFIHGDMDRLKLGVSLSIPRSTITAPAVAPALLTNPPISPPISRAPRLTESTYSASDPFAEGLDVTPVRRPDRPDLELQARLAAMDAKFAAIRAKYEIAMPAEPIETQTKEPTLDARMAVVKPASPSAIAATGSTPANSALETPAATVPRSNGGMLAAMLGTAVLGVTLLIVYRYRGLRRRAQDSAAGLLEADRRASVAQKAEHRVRTESAIRDSIKPDSTSEISLLPAADATRTTLSAIQPAPLPIETDIDSSIAHGRYAEAERLLREVIVTTPLNTAAKLRLAEVYYITERVAEFNEIAIDLQQQHRADLSPEEWQRLQRMGKIISPDMPMFSGPRAIDRRS